MRNQPQDTDQAPKTQTSPSLLGGEPPLPPHNGPPTLVGLAMADDHDGQMDNVIKAATEEEALKTIKDMGYRVTRRSGMTKPAPRETLEADSARECIVRGIQHLREGMADIFIGTSAALYGKTRESIQALYYAAHAWCEDNIPPMPSPKLAPDWMVNLVRRSGEPAKKGGLPAAE